MSSGHAAAARWWATSADYANFGYDESTFFAKVVSLLVSEFSCRWDESGVDPGTKTRSRSDRPVLVVAGYLAHADDWEALEEKWIAVLARHGLAERGFHMVEFFNHRYPYSKLSKTDYGALIDALLDIVHFHPRMFVSFSMETKDYMDVIKARHLLEEDIVRAYHILARRCILMIFRCSQTFRTQR